MDAPESMRRPKAVDVQGHASDLVRYRARGYRMAGNRIRLVADRPHRSSKRDRRR